MVYAEGTEVSPEKSRAEIELVLRKHGSKSILSGYDEERGFIAFVWKNRQVRFSIRIPQIADERFRVNGRGSWLTSAAREKKRAAAVRQVWRALLLVIKAKLETVESQIATFEEEFLPYLVLPNGRTLGDEVMPAVMEAIESGRMPARLLALPGRAEAGGSAGRPETIEGEIVEAN